MNLPINGRMCVLSHFSHVQLLEIPWTIAHQVLCPWDYPGKNTGVNCHALFQGIFSTQDQTWVSCIAGSFFTAEPPGKTKQKDTPSSKP